MSAINQTPPIFSQPSFSKKEDVPSPLLSRTKSRSPLLTKRADIPYPDSEDEKDAPPPKNLQESVLRVSEACKSLLPGTIEFKVRKGANSKLKRTIIEKIEANKAKETDLEAIQINIRKEIEKLYPDLNDEKKKGELTSLYIQKTGVILKPMIIRLNIIQRYLTNAIVEEEQYQTPFAQELHNTINKLLQFEPVRRSIRQELQIEVGKDLKKFLETINELEKKPRKIINYCFGKDKERQETAKAALTKLAYSNV